MAVPRFFVALDLAPAMAGQTLDLPDAAAHHAVRVLRLTVGDSVRLFNGSGGEYAATITGIDKRGVAVRIDHYDPVERESSLALTLAQAITANDAMDYAVRKATELGVTSIQPIISARSAPLPAGERGTKRHGHWRQVAIAACEQCGRNRIPEIGAAQSLSDWLPAWRGSGVMLVPDAERTLAAIGKLAAPIALLIGPEGGWIDAEVSAALRAGFIAVRLGPRILRADTAATAALAAIQLLCGDFR